MTASIHLKRIHDPVDQRDGRRILVDRLWPRGIRREDARLDTWLRDIAPSTALRRWFGHDPERWQEFQARYRQELADADDAMTELLRYCRAGPVTLLFAARDRKRNQAVVLRDVLRERLEREQASGESASPVCYARDFPGYFGEGD